ncbi:P-loop containing nucleoside triphosphate hydrolase [Sesbania bispinosa]|nr:P-loop containing nucleoside triphosphate hydrolase [Sesbania bispinosa]
MELLQVESNGVRVLGLYGMGGVGKTTLAKALFNSLVGRFERRCFISNVKHYSSKDGGLVSLQSKIISDLSPEQGSRVHIISDVNVGIRRGTRCTQGVVLDFEEQIKQWITNYPQYQAEKKNEIILNTKSFELMVNLRLLQINNLILEGKFLPAELKWLQWRECPLEYMPLDSWPRELAVLDLSNSKKIKSLWGLEGYKAPENLMVLNLSNCVQLTAIPDLSGCHRLEKIKLESCSNVKRIHNSIGSLTALRSLNLKYCSNLVELPSDVSGLTNLEIIYLSHCLKLKALPKNIGRLISLKTLLADHTAIAELPQSIYRLTKLEQLVLDYCPHLIMLPNCIGHLCSLQELSLNHSGLKELSNSVGSLKNLEKLSLIGCESLNVIPDSIGNLISLTELLVSNSGIRELPSSICSLSYLRKLSVGNCKFLSKLPNSIKTLASILELKLDGTTITNLPDQIGEMKQLRKLEIGNCIHLEALPESIGNLASLTTLNIVNGKIRELPDSIGLLENLVTLRLNRCRMLRMLPASIGNLKSLCHFEMEETAMSDLPESFGMLSSLRTLRMAKRPHLVPSNCSLQQQLQPQYQDHISDRIHDCIVTTIAASSATIVRKVRHLMQPKTMVINSSEFVRPSSFGNLTLLYELDARAWRISGRIPDDFEKLSSLETLNLGQNNFHSLPSSLKGLSILKKLALPNCRELISLPSLPSSLIELNVENCSALETIHDISNLESLQELKLTNCEKVVDIKGLECLKSLRRLYLSGCTACSSRICKRLSKGMMIMMETKNHWTKAYNLSQKDWPSFSTLVKVAILEKNKGGRLRINPIDGIYMKAKELELDQLGPAWDLKAEEHHHMEG